MPKVGKIVQKMQLILFHSGFILWKGGRKLSDTFQHCHSVGIVNVCSRYEDRLSYIVWFLVKHGRRI